jgi:hypothetical protein
MTQVFTGYQVREMLYAWDTNTHSLQIIKYDTESTYDWLHENCHGWRDHVLTYKQQSLKDKKLLPSYN